jgi:hypothetical protein
MNNNDHSTDNYSVLTNRVGESEYAVANPQLTAIEHLMTPVNQPNNGRIQVHPDEHFHPYQFAATNQHSVKPASNLANMQESTLLSQAYFSHENTQIIQNGLRRNVFLRTNKHVLEQNTEQLQIVMRSIFLQYSTNRTDSAELIREQIESLNKKVLDYCVSNVVSNLKQYEHYRKDISSLPVPMEYGQSTSQAGTRSLLQGPLI